MKTQKIKRYRLSVRRTFPEGHPRAGQETGFIRKIENAVLGKCYRCAAKNNKGLCLEFECQEHDVWCKLHTVRANYEYWKKITEQVQRGEAIIELFYWSGSPYNSKRDGSKQVVFATLDKDSGCGVQELKFLDSKFDFPYVLFMHNPLSRVFKGLQRDLAKNDGLSLDDFKAWFKSYDLSKPMAIIQFTGFRY